MVKLARYEQIWQTYFKQREINKQFEMFLNTRYFLWNSFPGCVLVALLYNLLSLLSIVLFNEFSMITNICNIIIIYIWNIYSLMKINIRFKKSRDCHFFIFPKVHTHTWTIHIQKIINKCLHNSITGVDIIAGLSTPKRTFPAEES